MKSSPVSSVARSRPRRISSHTGRGRKHEEARGSEDQLISQSPFLRAVDGI
jgi:hypothetical protein